MINFLRQIQNRGLRIDTIYDIGAYKGDWSRQIKDLACPNSKFILFEANNSYVHNLINSGFINFNVTLSNPGREYVDFYNGNNTGDSYYQETTEFYANQPSIRLPCTTLDKVVKENNLPIPNFIKIDTQGSELDILFGAESFIDRVDLIYTECPIICYNKGAPSIQDYINYFKKKEFIPITIFEIHRIEETLMQIDIMFMRREAKELYLQPNHYIKPLI
jgi:FkbM family methyltransferase